MFVNFPIDTIFYIKIITNSFCNFRQAQWFEDPSKIVPELKFFFIRFSINEFNDLINKILLNNWFAL